MTPPYVGVVLLRLDASCLGCNIGRVILHALYLVCLFCRLITKLGTCLLIVPCQWAANKVVGEAGLV